jgi:hypothetical protein
MNAKKTFLLVYPYQQSVDVLRTRVNLSVSTLFYVLMKCRQRSVENPHGCRRINTSTRVFRGNSKNNFFHVHKGPTEAL